MRPGRNANGHYTRISLAAEDGSTVRLGTIRGSVQEDGSCSASAFDIEDAAAAQKPDIVVGVCNPCGPRP